MRRANETDERSRHKRALLLCIVMAAATATNAPDAAAQSAADVAAARQLFIEGSELSKAGRWEQARDRFRRSLELKRAPITLYSLGVAQMSSGQHVEALESFRAFLAEPVTDTTSPYVDPARGAIDELERRVARLDIAVRPGNLEGLVVSVDRVDVPSAALGLPRLVNAGEHVVRARAPGYGTRTAAITVAEAETKPVVLVLSPASPSETASGAASSGDFPTGPVILMSVGGATAVAGIGVGLAGVAEAGDATSPDSPEADRARTKATVGDVLAAVGIGAALAGVLWLVLDDDGDDAAPGPTAATIRPRVTADGLVWSF
ncbi:MAG: hypothetical protein RIF41_13630 [Polyangiaceae bacterium]